MSAESSLTAVAIVRALLNQDTESLAVLLPDDLVGAGNPVTLCGLRILADQSAEPIPPPNPDIYAQGGCERPAGGFWCSARCGR